LNQEIRKSGKSGILAALLIAGLLAYAVAVALVFLFG
jgi:hypothetical protein